MISLNITMLASDYASTPGEVIFIGRHTKKEEVEFLLNRPENFNSQAPLALSLALLTPLRVGFLVLDY